MKSWLSVKAGFAPQAALHLVAMGLVLVASLTEDLEVTAAIVIVAVIALHFGAMAVLPRRLSLLLSLSPVVFSLSFLLWATDNGVDCSPSCSTYQDITAVVMGIGAVATAGGIVAGLVALVRKLWWRGEDQLPPKPTPH